MRKPTEIGKEKFSEFLRFVTRKGKETNAEKIRKMTDEQLAIYLCAEGWDLGDVNQCLEWLKKTDFFC